VTSGSEKSRAKSERFMMRYLGWRVGEETFVSVS